jgi:hypothetical protein
MGKRGWLTKVLNESLLPSLAQLTDSDEGREVAVQLGQSLRQQWAEHGLVALSQQQGLMDMTRRAIKDSLGEGHFSLEVIKFSTAEYVELNELKQRSVARRNEAVKQLINPDGIVATAVRLLDSPEWAEVAAGLAVLTGRRSSELLATGVFVPKSKWSVLFSGALKRKGELQKLHFEIPTLTTAQKVCGALDMIRQQLPQAASMSANAVNATFGSAVAAACDRHFAGVVPPRSGGNLYTHLFRAVYATIATFWYCPPNVDPIEFRAAIQGHYAVLDAQNSELRRSLAASRHYADFEIADKVIAQYGGKRKGIKLGAAGIRPIEMFEGVEKDMEVSMVDEAVQSDFRATGRSRRGCSSLRLWKDDREALNKVLDCFQGHSQQDRVGAWIEWSLQQLKHPDGEQQASGNQLQGDDGVAKGAIAPGQDDAVMDDDLAQGRSEDNGTAGLAVPFSAQAQGMDEDEALPPRPLGVVTQPLPQLQQTQPLPQTHNAGPLGDKIDKLIDVMAQFVQLQVQQAQGAGAGKEPTRGSSRSDALAPGEGAQGRKYRSGDDERVVNAAIDAIIKHNDNEPLYDLKWAITINTLKAFSKNQRVIERVLGKGKDNPSVLRVIGAREDEIEQHHAKHQLQPGHNHRHKRKRTIGEVVRIE